MNQPRVRMFDTGQNDDLHWQRLARDAADATQTLPVSDAADAPTRVDLGAPSLVALENEPSVGSAPGDGDRPSRLRRRLTILATALMLTGSVVLATAAASNQLPGSEPPAAPAAPKERGPKKEPVNNKAIPSGAQAGNAASAATGSSGSGSGSAPTGTSAPTPTTSATPSSSPSGSPAPTGSPSVSATPTPSGSSSAEPSTSVVAAKQPVSPWQAQP